MSRKNHTFRQRAVINFTQVTNNVLQNPKLSLKAKGLYSYIQSYLLIPNFELNKSFLLKNCIEGEKAFDSAWKELKDFGFLKQYRIPNPDDRGKFLYEYELLLEADTTTPSLINCDINGNPVVKKVDFDHTPQKGPYAKRIPCSEDAMLNGGDNNNISSNNTNLNNNKSSSIDDDDLNIIMKYCQEVEYKLTKNKARALLMNYDVNKIIKAIAQIISSGAIVKNYSAYLTKTLSEMTLIKVINVTKPEAPKVNPRGFNNFEQRERSKEEYDDLERKLLGWE